MRSLNQKIVFILLCLLALLVAFSSHPYIVDISRDAGIEKGSILSRYIIVVFILLFVLCYSWNEFTKSKTIRIFGFFVLWIFLFSLITISLYSDRKLFGEIRPLLICLIALAVGWRLDMDDRRLRILLLVYSVCVIYIGATQVLTNIGGFVIEDQILTDNKNALGLMLASTISILSFLAFDRSLGKMPSFLSWIAIFVTFFVLLTIRARTATLVAFLIVLLILLRKVNKSYLLLIVILIPILGFLVIVFMPSTIRDFVVGSFFSGYEGRDITSGRMSRNWAALDYLAYHPILGNLRHTSEDFGWVHNFPLLQLFNNGLLFAFPILSLYVYLFVSIVRSVFQCKVTHIREVGIFAALIPFIESLSEPTFPFGPGTATVFNFILFGVALKYVWVEKYLNDERVIE